MASKFGTSKDMIIKKMSLNLWLFSVSIKVHDLNACMAVIIIMICQVDVTQMGVKMAFLLLYIVIKLSQQITKNVTESPYFVQNNLEGIWIKFFVTILSTSFIQELLFIYLSWAYTESDYKLVPKIQTLAQPTALIHQELLVA